MSEFKFPQRRQFDEECEKSIRRVFSYYRKLNRDFSTHGKFVEDYKTSFLKVLAKPEVGHCELVNSGTTAVFVALKALHLPEKSHVLVSPITDPGMINAVILAGLRPKVVDFAANSMFSGLAEFQSRVDKKTRAVLVNHLSGIPLPELYRIYRWARKNKIFLIEDASQCHGGYVKTPEGRASVGTVSDISCFSTMFSKSHSTGGAGGVVYTKNPQLAKRIHLQVDKGKPRFKKNFNEKNPEQFVIPALNLGLNELSAAIGSVTLKNLGRVNRRRLEFLRLLRLEMKKLAVKTELISGEDGEAPYFAVLKSPILPKRKFAEALKAAGLPLNIDYKYLVHRWPYVQPYLADRFVPKNAAAFNAETFNLLFNENFGKREAAYIAHRLKRIETKFKI